MYLLHLFTFFFCSLFYPFPGNTTEQDKGTLVVSYSTGEKAERLNRVRFSLASDNYVEQMYPKGDAFVEGLDCHSRMIVIEHLPVGEYLLKFLVPNSDRLFEPIPETTVTIVKDKIIRVDQNIYPRYATVRAKTSLLPEDSFSEKPPALTLEDSQGNIRAHSLTGKLVAHFLLPGSYTLKFEPLLGYHTPDPLILNIDAGATIGPFMGTYVWEGMAATTNDSPLIAESIITRRPSGTVIINQINAQLTVNNNLQKARWTLLKNNDPVYNGLGSVVNFQIVDGDNYRIVPEQIEGYIVSVSPSSTFSLYPAQTMYATIAYERTFGTMTIEAPFPERESISITIRSKETPPMTFKVQSKGGKIFWQSRPLPTGPYEISYSLPANYSPIPADKVIIRRAERLQVTPQLAAKKGLRIIANIPEAIFLLRTPNSSKIWKGEGREYTFEDIPPGSYLLSFSAQDPDYFIPPKEMKVFVNDNDGKEIKVNFQIAGKLTIKTNVDRSHAVIKELGGMQRTYQENILNHSKVFNLPEGRYRITLSTLSEDKGTTANFSPPDPIEISLKALSAEDVNLSFKINNTPKEKQRHLSVLAGITNAGFTIYKLNDNGKELIGHFSGKNTQVTLPSADHYEITYDDVPNYKTPDSETLEIKAGEDKTLQANYVPLLSMIDIPAGKAIVGDATSEEKINELPAKVVHLSAFSIGIYEVTNAEFATWLNTAIKTGTISYVKEADSRGQVLNMKDQLLFKTFEADSYSQISAQLQSTDTPTFMPLAGKDSYPVINVSWYGAVEYCKDNNCRLPTEAEWEKVAGMVPGDQGNPLKKFIYGFGRDEINPTWANYKDNADNIQHFQVLTTPVGFYNGTNSLPLSINRNHQQQTNLAKSPYGAFDMSGNVWEWTSDWYDDSYYVNMTEIDPKGPASGTQKVVKGGCYDSLSDGVRVTERMGLPLDYSDAYTGFRIAK